MSQRSETIALLAGQESPDPATGARAVPIYQTTSFNFKNAFIGNTVLTGLFPNLFAQTGLFLISK